MKSQVQLLNCSSLSQNQILGINMSVGVDGCLGKTMIREGKGLDISVRRSLRDVFRRVPTFSLEVKVISCCIFSNLLSLSFFSLFLLPLFIDSWIFSL